MVLTDVGRCCQVFADLSFAFRRWALRLNDFESLVVFATVFRWRRLMWFCTIASKQICCSVAVESDALSGLVSLLLEPLRRIAGLDLILFVFVAFEMCGTAMRSRLSANMDLI